MGIDPVAHHRLRHRNVALVKGLGCSRAPHCEVAEHVAHLVAMVRAVELARENQVDLVLAVGGGSAIDAAMAWQRDGAEWIHLSGAWQARIGDPDGRFVPSLFQALSTLVLHISSSEVGPRIAAFMYEGRARKPR